MVKMTSAYAAKLIKKLNEEKSYWISLEEERCVYVASVEEEPVIPEYDFEEVRGHLAEIDDRIVRIKHAMNISNSSNEVRVNDRTMTIDIILIRMAQLNRRLAVLDEMRKRQPKTRLETNVFSSRKTSPEYRYTNYDLTLVGDEYKRVEAEITAMQLALDKYNQTVEIDIDVDLDLDINIDI